MSGSFDPKSVTVTLSTIFDAAKAIIAMDNVAVEPLGLCGVGPLPRQLSPWITPWCIPLPPSDGTFDAATAITTMDNTVMVPVVPVRCAL